MNPNAMNPNAMNPNDFMVAESAHGRRADSDVTSGPRRAFHALFPEIPADADRQILGLGLIVGALTFSALLGWGPQGQWLKALRPPGRRSVTSAAAPRAHHGAAAVAAVVSSPNSTVVKATLPTDARPPSTSTETALPTSTPVAARGEAPRSSVAAVSVAAGSVPAASAVDTTLAALVFEVPGNFAASDNNAAPAVTVQPSKVSAPSTVSAPATSQP